MVKLHHLKKECFSFSSVVLVSWRKPLEWWIIIDFGHDPVLLFMGIWFTRFPCRSFTLSIMKNGLLFVNDSLSRTNQRVKTSPHIFSSCIMFIMFLLSLISCNGENTRSRSAFIYLLTFQHYFLLTMLY